MPERRLLPPGVLLVLSDPSGKDAGEKTITRNVSAMIMSFTFILVSRSAWILSRVLMTLSTMGYGTPDPRVLIRQERALLP